VTCGSPRLGAGSNWRLNEQNKLNYLDITDNVFLEENKSQIFDLYTTTIFVEGGRVIVWFR